MRLVKSVMVFNIVVTSSVADVFSQKQQQATTFI